MTENRDISFVVLQSFGFYNPNAKTF